MCLGRPGRKSIEVVADDVRLRAGRFRHNIELALTQARHTVVPQCEREPGTTALPHGAYAVLITVLVLELRPSVLPHNLSASLALAYLA